ncbi:hypothetical protein IFM89_014624 [Coptis chinensis]|uniref:Uncharacterized protein n=1 Tax=Coptis chinensis TaxID=261450 RepID=A0A835IP41_9MAGN|nr:hypothetical protein IFM89_014624 [Coptis chinensis]
MLCLRSFCFNGSEFMHELLSSCPVLDTLSIRNCGLHETDSLVITATQLKHLEIDMILSCEDHCLREKNCKIGIYTPMLKSLKCRDHISNEYSIKDLSSLDEADIYMEVRKSYFEAAEEDVLIRFDWKKEFSMNVKKLLGGLCNAKSLTLSAWFVEVCFKS